jgi:hypothetical protein
MNRITKKAAQAYNARWQLVARREIEETRRTSATVKYRQFLELLRWAQTLAGRRRRGGSPALATIAESISWPRRKAPHYLLNPCAISSLGGNRRACAA